MVGKYNLRQGGTMARNNLRLYDIPDAIRAIEAEIIDAQGEMSPEIEGQLDDLQETFSSKAEYIGLLALEAKAEAAGVRQEAERLSARVRTAENREKRLKEYLFTCMNRLGIQKVEGAAVKLRIQANSQ